MSSFVLDASAMLAVINAEPGSDKLTTELLARAAFSAVNLAEVQTKLVSWGWDPDEAWGDAIGTVAEIVPFTADQARMTGNLVQDTRSLGLSLGDRACLALGIARHCPIYTADRSWKKLKLRIPIHVIR